MFKIKPITQNGFNDYILLLEETISEAKALFDLGGPKKEVHKWMDKIEQIAKIMEIKF